GGLAHLGRDPQAPAAAEHPLALAALPGFCVAQIEEVLAARGAHVCDARADVRDNPHLQLAVAVSVGVRPTAVGFLLNLNGVHGCGGWLRDDDGRSSQQESGEAARQGSLGSGHRSRGLPASDFSTLLLATSPTLP